MSKSQHTKGPWAWFGNATTRDIYLATSHSGRRYVMRFQRWGLDRAQPSFQLNSKMVPAQELLKFEVGDDSVIGVSEARKNDSVYRLDITDIDCPDARLIKAAPDMYEALEIAQDYFSLMKDILANSCEHHVGEMIDTRLMKGKKLDELYDLFQKKTSEVMAQIEGKREIS